MRDQAAEENVTELFEWGKGLVQAASAAGFPMAPLPESIHTRAFISWAQEVNRGVEAMVSLPRLPDDAGYDEALAWARALDNAARGMGVILPPLPHSGPSASGEGESGISEGMTALACVFCEIVAGRVHQPLVFEDEAVLALMDLRQPREGHVLVVPKRHVQDIFGLDGPTGAAVMSAVVTVSRAVRAGLGCDGVSIWSSNGPGARQEVPHLHLHVLPRFLGDGLFRVYPEPPARPDATELERQAALIRAKL